MKYYTLKLQSANKVRKREIFGTPKHILDVFLENDWINEEWFREEYEIDLLSFYNEEGDYIKGYLESNNLTEEDYINIIDSCGDWYYKEWIEEE